jgi:transposase
MDTIIERCAALDIGKKTLTACVRTPDGKSGRRSETRTFSTMTRQLLVLRDWLATERVTVVAMESTSTYWKAPFYLLEDDFDVWLLNARHLQAVPGRKTDVKDAEWIAQLTECGLVRSSFVPPKPVRRLRNLTRYRKTVIEERSREAQRLEKLLEDAGIKLSSVATDILGVSGRAMLAQLVTGNTDPAAMAELAKGRMRPKIPTLTEALTGWFDDHHALLVTEMLTRIDAAEATITRLDEQIDAELLPFAEALALLDTIPGVGKRTAQVIVAETGADMTRFPTAAHLASWAGVCPGVNESAGKRHSSRCRAGDKWLRAALVEAAHAAARTKDTYLAATYARIAGRRGPKRAAVAVAHSILVIAYHLLDQHVAYTDLGADFLIRRHTADAHIRRLVTQLEKLGQKVTIEPVESAA